jgi:hypothetical protein
LIHEGLPLFVTPDHRALIPQHPMRVMSWALKHKHELFLNRSAEHALKLRSWASGPYLWVCIHVAAIKWWLSIALSKFKYLLHWQILYSQALLKLHQAMHFRSSGGHCLGWRDHIFPGLINKIGTELVTLTSNLESYRNDFDQKFRQCAQCEEKFMEWVTFVHELRDRIPPFSAEEEDED